MNVNISALGSEKLLQTAPQKLESTRFLISDQTMQWLEQYRRRARPTQALQIAHSIFFCQHAPSRADHGAPLTVHALRHFFETMSLPESKGGTGLHVTPHMLRHTWNVLAEEDGVPIDVRKAHMGHQHLLNRPVQWCEHCIRTDDSF